MWTHANSIEPVNRPGGLGIAREGWISCFRGSGFYPRFACRGMRRSWCFRLVICLLYLDRDCHDRHNGAHSGLDWTTPDGGSEPSSWVATLSPPQTVTKNFDVPSGPIALPATRSIRHRQHVCRGIGFPGAPVTGLALTRYYNSQDAGDSGFGTGWHSTWHRPLELISAQHGDRHARRRARGYVSR